MNKKKIKLILSEVKGDLYSDVYKVKKAVNTVEYSIGEYVDKKLIKDLIKWNNNYTIEIV
jgi:hypothetical protein